MSITIIEKQIEIGTHLHNLIISEIESAVKHHLDEGIEATVTLTKNTQTNKRVHTDIQIRVGEQFSAHCLGHGHDAHKSVAMVIEKLKEQLRRPRTHLIDTKSQMCNHEHHDGFRRSN